MFDKSWLNFLLAALVGIHLIIALGLAFNRLSYNAIIDAQESEYGGYAYQMSQGDHGYSSVDITHHMIAYTPLSFAMQSWVLKIFGVDMRWQRLLAALLGFGAAALLALCVHSATGRIFPAFIAACFLLGIDVQGWFVKTGPDAPHVFFALAGLYFLIRTENLSLKTACLPAVGCAYLSFMCKQPGLFYIIASLIFIFSRDIKKGVASAAFTFLLLGATFFYYHIILKSFFLERVFILFYEPIVFSRFFSETFFPNLVGRFGVLMAVIAGGLLIFIKNWRDLFRAEYIFLGAASSGILTSMKYGSGNNQCIMLYAMIILCGMSLLYLLVSKQFVAQPLAAGMLAVQCLALFHPVAVEFINKADIERFNIVQRILAEPGKRVYYYEFGYNNLYVNKPYVGNLYRDTRAQWKEGRIVYPQPIVDFFASCPFDTILINVPWEDNSILIRQQLEQHYTLALDIPPSIMYPNTKRLRSRILGFQRKTQTQ